MQLATMRAEVRERLGETTEEDFWKDAHITRMLNEGVIRFCYEEDWPWLYAVRLGTIFKDQTVIDLELDIDVNRHFGFLVTEGTTRAFTMRHVSPGDGIRLRAELYGQAGPPRYYWIESIVDTGPALSQRIRFAPKADKAYTVEYSFLRNPTDLVLDTDEPNIPEVYQEAIIAFATGMLWLKELSGAGKAQEQFNLYNIVVEQARREMKALSVGDTLVWGRQAPDYRPEDRFPFVNLPPNIGI